MKKRRTNWDRVAELNEILGPVIEFAGMHFSLMRNAKDFKHPYCLANNSCGSAEMSLDFKGMKAVAQRMRAAYDAGGDICAVRGARYSY